MARGVARGRGRPKRGEIRRGKSVIGYTRVSTGRQADEGVSLETQAEKIRQYCQLHELELVGIKEDVLSARKEVRPVLDECLDALRSGQADGLVVWNMDRFARRVRDVSTMIDEYFSESDRSLGCRLISVTESLDTFTAGGRLVVNVLASVHQWEAERLSERVSANMARLREQGFWAGGNLPYGYQPKARAWTNDGRHLPRRLEANPRELETIAKANELHAAGKSLREIAQELGRLKLRPRTGGSWHPQQIANMLSGTSRPGATSS